MSEKYFVALLRSPGIPLLLSGVICVLACASCDSPSFWSDVNVVGEVLQIRVDAPAGAVVAASSQRIEAESDIDHAEIYLYIALERFQPGRNEIDIEMTESGQTTRESVSFVVPEGVGAPFLQIHECRDVPSAGWYSTEVGGVFGQLDECREDQALNIQLNATTNPTATLRVDGELVGVGADGNVTVNLSVASTLMAARLTEATEHRDEGVMLEALVQIEKAGEEPVTGSIWFVIDTQYAMRNLLRGYQPGSALFEGRAISSEARQDRTVVSFDPATLRVAAFGGGGTIADIDYVALFEDQPGRSGGSCGPYVTDDGASFSASRTNIDVVVTIYDARSGEEVQSQHFNAAREPCPTVAWVSGYSTSGLDVRPDIVVTHGWLEAFADTPSQ